MNIEQFLEILKSACRSIVSIYCLCIRRITRSTINDLLLKLQLSKHNTLSVCYTFTIIYKYIYIYIYVYIYIYMCVCVCVCVFILVENLPFSTFIGFNRFYQQHLLVTCSLALLVMFPVLLSKLVRQSWHVLQQCQATLFTIFLSCFL